MTNEDWVPLPNFPHGEATLINPVVSVANIDDPLTPYAEGVDFDVNYTGAQNEIQTVTIGGTPGGGTFTLTFGEETTADIAYDAAAAAVESALELLTNLAPSDVAVTGSAGGPYTVTFSGQYTDTNVVELVGDASGLTGGTEPSVSVSTVADGGTRATVSRIDGGDIAEGETVTVVYRYLPDLYFHPTRLDQQSQVEEFYGPAFNSDGTINSPVSFAAQITFENGAREVIIQALFKRTTDNDPDSVRLQPSNTQVETTAPWEHSFYALRDIEDINLIVPIIGQSHAGLTDDEWLAIAKKLQDHVRFMNEEQQYIVGIVGEDSSASTTVAERDTLRTHAEDLRQRYGGAIAEQFVMPNLSRYNRTNPVTSQNFVVGGQYVAAAIAGMLAGRRVSASITRQTIGGFSGSSDFRSRSDKNADAQAGLLVVDTKGNALQIRHGITLDNSATVRREIPIVRAKHRMIESVRDTLESSVIGNTYGNEAPAVVASTVQSVLEDLVEEGDIVGYSDIQARTLTLDPTTVEVRFSYRPAFPLNYIRISFSLDLSTGTVTV